MSVNALNGLLSFLRILTGRTVCRRKCVNALNGLLSFLRNIMRIRNIVRIVSTP